MLPIRFVNDGAGAAIETSLRGASLLGASLVNKDCAFDESERRNLGLLGLLPQRVESLEDQLGRETEQFSRLKSALEKNEYLRDLQDRNEILYFRLVQDRLVEMLPILYTPEVGEAVETFSHSYRRARGLYVAYPDRDRLDEVLANRRYRDVDVICATDASAILGIGDQGVGGMGIPIAKLAVDSLCGAVHPSRVLPVMLDVGTDNETIRNDADYLGWRHKRIRGPDYFDFVGKFVAAVKRQLPGVFLHWEDFSRDCAEQLLETYRDELCSFNDDIQGTGAITVAALYSALKASTQKLADQRIVIFGAGAAGLGNADQIVGALVREGLSDAQARARIWAIDRRGLIVHGGDGFTAKQESYGRTVDEVRDWQRDAQGTFNLAETVKRVRPTVLIGTSTVAGAFNESIVAQVTEAAKRPIIFPLSNPTPKAEARPEDLLRWTKGQALIATGSPFDPVTHDGRTFQIAQCNNAFCFPGITLGVVATKASKVTDNMLWAAVQAVSDLSPAIEDATNGLLPPVRAIRDVCRKVGTAVARQALADGVATLGSGDAESLIARQIWSPQYPPVRCSAAVGDPSA